MRWLRILLALIATQALARAEAADLTRVTLSRDGTTIVLTLELTAPSRHETALRSDGLVATVRLPEVVKIPPLPILDADAAGLDAAFIERDHDGTGAKITLISHEALMIPPEAPADGGTLVIRFPLAKPPSKPEAKPAPKPAPKIAQTPPPQPAVSPKPAKPGTPDDPLMRAALKGDQNAQVQLGSRSLTAKPPDGAAARKWFEMAAKHGNTIAAFNLGQLARRGIGGPADDAVAMKWYRMAAEQGLAQAQFNLALMLLKAGNPEARRWLEAAAKQDYAPAREALKTIDASAPR